MVGFYTFINAQNKLAIVEYYADDTGYHPFSPKLLEVSTL